MMFRSVPFWAWIVVAVVFYVLSEYWSKLWSVRGTSLLAVLVYVGYGMTTLAWLGLMSHRSQLVVMSLSWQVCGALIAVLVGAVIFSEKLSVWQWCGVALGIVSTALLVIEPKQ